MLFFFLTCSIFFPSASLDLLCQLLLTSRLEQFVWPTRNGFMCSFSKHFWELTIAYEQPYRRLGCVERAVMETGVQGCVGTEGVRAAALCKVSNLDDIVLLCSHRNIPSFSKCPVSNSPVPTTWMDMFKKRFAWGKWLNYWCRELILSLTSF